MSDDMGSNIVMVDKQYLVDTNRKILTRHKLKHNVDVWIETAKPIDQIILMVNSVGNSGDRREDLVEKATYMMAMVTWAQPFFDGNRRTGIVATIKFLRDNGYDLDIDPEEENLELRSMLSEIKKHAGGLELGIMSQLSFYISKRIKLYESRR